MSFKLAGGPALRRLAGSIPIPRHRALSTKANGKPLLVLGLESSADDTCAAIVSSERKVLSNVVLKQSTIHESFGGIHPLHAQEAHQRNMPFAIRQALGDANVTLDDLDAIAFTRGPGMYGCLSVCAGAAKALAGATGKPLIGVHHMQAHALTPFLTAHPRSSSPAPTFPFLTLLLSGGHTLLLLATSPTSFRILATTHDESIGASFDKAARDLEIPWELGKGSPGAALERFAFPPPDSASRADPDDSTTASEAERIEAFEQSLPEFKVPFPRQLAFSYAGLRSALTRILTSTPPSELSLSEKRLVANRFMLGAIRQVEEKVKVGIESLRDEGIEVKGLVVSGGVASNLVLRERLRSKLDSLALADLPLIFPPVHLCTDNAAMIAYVGLSRLERGERVDPLDVMQKSKWSIEECEADFEGPGRTKASP
ncbi:hypothetical protein JCM10212_006021 [Sporobolomyces blumeae]